MLKNMSRIHKNAIEGRNIKFNKFIVKFCVMWFFFFWLVPLSMSFYIKMPYNSRTSEFIVYISKYNAYYGVAVILILDLILTLIFFRGHKDKWLAFCLGLWVFIDYEMYFKKNFILTEYELLQNFLASIDRVKPDNIYYNFFYDKFTLLCLFSSIFISCQLIWFSFIATRQGQKFLKFSDRRMIENLKEDGKL